MKALKVEIESVIVGAALSSETATRFREGPDSDDICTKTIWNAYGHLKQMSVCSNFNDSRIFTAFGVDYHINDAVKFNSIVNFYWFVMRPRSYGCFHISDRFAHQRHESDTSLAEIILDS